MRQEPLTGKAAILFLMLALTAIGCGSSQTDTGDEMSNRPIEDVLAEHTPGLMAIPGVTGTYQGEREDGTPCITVMVVERTAEVDSRVPDRLEGHPVIIEVTGEIREMPDRDG